MDQRLLFDNDDEDLRKSYERARKLALKKQQGGAKTFPESIASLASSRSNDSTLQDNPSSISGESQENKVVFTEMEEFVWGLQLHEQEQKHGCDNVFMKKTVLPKSADGWKEEVEITPDETIHEEPIGKGLSGALKFSRGRGTLKEDIELVGRNMDKKKCKLEGVCGDHEGEKEIHIERTDEYGCILTWKESFRLFSHKFHGIRPGKRKQEKRMRKHPNSRIG